MKTKRLVIRKPCNEAWSEMTPQENGRHCAKCDKVVVDLTSTDVRSAFQLVNKSEQSMCVRLLPQHLDYVHFGEADPARRDFSLKAIAMGAALITLASLNSCAPEKHIRGKVKVVNTSEGHSVKKPSTPEETKTYTLYVKDGYSHKAIPDVTVALFHGKETDSLQTNHKGGCSFTISENEFRVEVYNPYNAYSQIVELTQQDFRSGKATAKLFHLSIMGEVAPEE